MGLAGWGGGVVTVVGLAGCATLACRPGTRVVAHQEERTRLDSEFRGVRTDQLGRVQENRRDAIVHEFWIRDQEGTWWRVPERAWRGVTIGESLEVCR